jgi:hypothetical protein
MAFPLLALLAAAQAAQQLTHKDPAQMMTPSAKPSQLPGVPVGGFSTAAQQVPDLAANVMAINAPSAPEATNLLAATRLNGAGQQPALDALKAAAAQDQNAQTNAQPSALLDLLRQSAPQQANRAPAAAKEASDSAPSDGQAVGYNPAPGVQGNDVEQETTGIGKLKADASQGQTFMGLSGGEWGSIGQAAGVFANLMKKLPPLPTLTPGARGPGGIPLAPVGGDLYSPGAQRLGNASQFAINSPNADNASILRALHSASQVQ